MSIDCDAGTQKDIYRACQSVVKGLRNRPGYSVIGELDFVMRLYACVCESLQTQSSEKLPAEFEQMITPLAKGVYSEALFIMWCSKKTSDQECACQELGDYLYRIAYNYYIQRKCPVSLAENLGRDSAQQTLLQIHRHIETIKEAKSFIGYAIKILYRECFHTLQESVKEGEMGRWQKESPIGHSDSQSNFPKGVQHRSGTNLTDTIFSSTELIDCLMQAIHRLPNLDWQKVLVLGFFAGMDDDQIAETLGISSGNVQTIRHRAIHRLRADTLLRDSIWGNDWK